ncbi:MAG: branched-chain amino acid ABC transporter permease [Desulfatiglandaceae bacterium]
MDYFLGLVVNGIIVGSIYSLVALGLVLIYKATEVVNFAQGELLMIGAYICLEIIVKTGMPFIPAFLMSMGFMAILALIIERVVLRKMLEAPVMSVIMVTVGIGVILRAVVILVWKAISIPFPEIFSREGVSLGFITIGQVYIWSFVLTLIFMGLFGVFFKYTRIGLVMRATASSRKAAESMGVPLTKVFALAWVISAVVSCVGGVLTGNIAGLSPELSFYGIKVFPAVILGGLDSIVGASISGVIIGVLENLGGGYIKDLTGIRGLGPVAPFFVLVGILWIRPTGLFGKKEIERV